MCVFTYAWENRNYLQNYNSSTSTDKKHSVSQINDVQCVFWSDWWEASCDRMAVSGGSISNRATASGTRGKWRKLNEFNFKCIRIIKWCAPWNLVRKFHGVANRYDIVYDPCYWTATIALCNTMKFLPSCKLNAQKGVVWSLRRKTFAWHSTDASRIELMNCAQTTEDDGRRWNGCIHKAHSQIRWTSIGEQLQQNFYGTEQSYWLKNDICNLFMSDYKAQSYRERFRFDWKRLTACLYFQLDEAFT